MRTFRPVLGLLCLVSLAGMPGCRSGGGAPGSTEPPSSAAEAPHGGRLFQQHCARCHGVLGRGDGALAGMHAVPSLVGTGLETRWDDAALSALLLEGRGAMPRFAHLRDEERQAVLAHVRRLVDGGRPPSNEPPQEP